MLQNKMDHIQFTVNTNIQIEKHTILFLVCCMPYSPGHPHGFLHKGTFSIHLWSIRCCLYVWKTLGIPISHVRLQRGFTVCTDTLAWPACLCWLDYLCLSRMSKMS